jgi:hypothetical protein
VPEVKVHHPVPLGGAPVVLGTALAATRWLAAAGRAAATATATANADGTRGPDPGNVLVGAASIAEEGVRNAITLAGAMLGPPVGLLPGFVRRPVRDAVRELDRRGRAATAASTDEAARFMATLVEAVAVHPVVVRAVQQIADQVIWPIVDEVLPQVLDRLATEPEQVRAIVQGQSLSILDELATTARGRAADGDEAVQRLVGRLLRRRRTGAGERPLDGVIGPVVPPLATES